MRPIQLLPLTQSLSLNDLDEIVGDLLIVADAYMDSAETWTPAAWGWRTEQRDRRICNVDHHAPVPRMRRAISSGNLAIEFVGENPDMSEGIVVINHCDCDSIVAAAILSGRVEASDELGQAVIAADHSGEPNRIADTLQPLESLRDLNLSLFTLDQLISGKTLPEKAQQLYEFRMEERIFWEKEIGKGGVVKWIGPVALLESEQRIPAEMLTSVLPEAAVIITSKPLNSECWVMKVRLGRAGMGSSNLSLNNLGIELFDPAFGGRWNAGSNNRGGGTKLTPQEYAEKVASAIHSK